MILRKFVQILFIVLVMSALAVGIIFIVRIPSSASGDGAVSAACVSPLDGDGAEPADVLRVAALHGRLPAGVVVDGTDVGGMARSAALSKIRRQTEERLKGERLRICCGEKIYVYRYPEFSYRDRLAETLAAVRTRGSYSSDVEIYLNGMGEIVDYICREAEKPMEEPSALFRSEGQPFAYRAGNDGVAADRVALAQDVVASLNGGFFDVRVKLYDVPRTLTEADVRRRTAVLGGFTTYFDGCNLGRSANIRLAASKLNGCVIGAGETLSFNAAVGERTVENGFANAKIILDGKFVEGVGGGVCQVSTTLYNAALLSGLRVEEYHPHSLAVGYVSLSRDAMVSGNYFDLKIKNDRAFPVYLRVAVSVNRIACTFYGESDGWSYSLLSERQETIPMPPEEIVEGDEDRILVNGREGAVSRGYLIARRGDEERKILLRTDRYAPIAQVRQIRRAEGENGQTRPDPAGI